MRKPKDIGHFETKADAIKAGFLPENFRGAFLSETLGPHFKPILWVGNRPFVRKGEKS